MIFGRRNIGGATFRPPITGEHGGSDLLAIELADMIETHNRDGIPVVREVKLVGVLDRTDVERLRDLCDEAHA